LGKAESGVSLENNLFGALPSLNDNRINSKKEPKKFIPARRQPMTTTSIYKPGTDNLLRNNLFGGIELIISSRMEIAGNGAEKPHEPAIPGTPFRE
jgi:hypothetical protein